MAGELDPYVGKGSQVLRNKPGLESEAALRSFEYERSAARSVQLQDRPITGRFDLEHLKAIHKHLFQDVYDWAGQTRSINISKGGSSFTKVEGIETAAARLSHKLQAENHLQGLDKSTFTKRLTEHFAGWNSLHPFREGNGRASREFAGQLARDAGYVLDQRRIDNGKDQWNQASRRAHAGELGGLEEIFRAAVRPQRAIAFETLSKDAALAAHPELKPTYDRMDAAKAVLERQYPGNEQAQGRFMSQAKVEAIRLLDTGRVHAPSISRDVGRDMAHDAARGPAPPAAARTEPARGPERGLER